MTIIWIIRKNVGMFTTEMAIILLLAQKLLQFINLFTIEINLFQGGKLGTHPKKQKQNIEEQIFIKNIFY